MASRTSFSSASALLTIFLSLPPALCHMELSWPYALRSKYNPDSPENLIDYSMTSPLEADGSNFPCKGYQNDSPSQPVVTYTAGSTYNMTLAGTATHDGGSCQLSLSYDNAKTFHVVKSMIGGCPLVSTYDFTIPSYAPSGNALLAWTWQNKVGNREFYMNCAAVSISSGMSRRQQSQTYSNISDLPDIWKANLKSVNDCATSEGENPNYPNPGPDVVYGDGMTSSDPPSEGDCDVPAGTTQQATASRYSSEMPAMTAPPSAYNIATITDSSSSTGTSTEYSTITLPPASYTGLNAKYAAYSGDTDSQSTTTLTVDCGGGTVTTTVRPTYEVTATTTPPPMYVTSAEPSACTGTSATCPCAAGYSCMVIGTCTWACMAGGMTSSSGFLTSTVPFTPAAATTSSSVAVVTSTATVVPMQTMSAATPPPQSYPSPTPSSSNGPGPGYATGDLDNYLPCVPGSFICTDANTFYTCDYNDGTDPDQPMNSYVYDYPRTVADGMDCLPNLSPYTDTTNQYAQQDQTEAGYYRDDRYVRARPDGDCDQDGAIQCTNGGQQFDICDQGGWVQMGPVANGTMCENGEIVSS